MKTHGIRKHWLSGLVIATCLLLAFGFVNKRNPAAKPAGVFSLRPPPFVSVASADTDAMLTSFLDNEAGISAYFQAPTSITLNDVRGLYRTIETETAQYIIGSIGVPNYAESEDVHVYIHVNGWVLAYYLKADPTGRIFNWKSYTGGTTVPTKLEKVLGVVAAQIGAPPPTSTFYHFQYPNANNLMLIADAVPGAGTDVFQVNIPSGFTYYERSWALQSSVCGGCFGRWRLNGVDIRVHGSGYVISQGTLTAGQLSLETLHTIGVIIEDGAGVESGAGGLALVYRIP